MVDLFAAMTWTPGFRGILVVAVGVIVLMGSVFLMLGTNSGFRLGFLISLTGLMGWMTIMGIVWMIYGIGYLGPQGSWEVVEINRGQLGAAETEVARTLPEPGELPEPTEFLEQDEDLAAQFAEQARPPSRGDLLSVKPELQEQMDIDGWRLLPSSDPQTGETQATASAYLIEDRKLFSSSDEYLVSDTFDKGGKERRDGDEGKLERAAIKIKNSLTLQHPTHYAVVQVQPAINQAARPGQPPPVPVADEEQPVISVIMVRDLGAKRLPSLVLTVFSAIIFLVCCSSLNRRDRLVAEARRNLPARV